MVGAVPSIRIIREKAGAADLCDAPFECDGWPPGLVLGHGAGHEPFDNLRVCRLVEYLRDADRQTARGGKAGGDTSGVEITARGEARSDAFGERVAEALESLGRQFLGEQLDDERGSRGCLLY